MKQTLEEINLINGNVGQSLWIQLICETLTDSSQVYNIIVVPRDGCVIILSNHDCTSKRQATAKYNAVVKALSGFEVS